MKTALVTGASRGVGRGIAVSLAESGFRVFATGRTIARANLPESITRMMCDHTSADQTAEVFERVKQTAGGLDVLDSGRGAALKRRMLNA